MGWPGDWGRCTGGSLAYIWRTSSHHLSTPYPTPIQHLSNIYPTNCKCLELGHMGGRQTEEFGMKKWLLSESRK